MAIQPKAKNNLPTSLLFENRKYYKDIYYPEKFDNNIDLWNEKYLYGKVDFDVNPIVLNPSYFKSLKINSAINQQPYYALNIVADSYAEMLEEIQRADQYLLIPKSIVNPIKPKKAAINSVTEYNNRIKLILDSLLSTELSLLENKIITFNDFLKLFISNISLTSIKISQSSLILGNNYSPNITGLVIELSTLKHDNDEKKAKDYLENDNYEFFINTAEKFSFFVDKNAPWRLVYNVSTKYAENKLNNYNIINIKEAFKKFYSPCFLTDYKLLRDSLVQYYTDNVLIKPRTQQSKYCIENKIIINKTITKESGDKLNKPDIFWIQMYYYIRLKESNIKLSQTEFNKNLDYIKNLYSLSGEKRVLEYINSKAKFVVDGGANPEYNDFVNAKKKNINNLSSFVFNF